MRPGDRQRNEQNDDGNGIADRPSDEVHEPLTALLTLTRSPSFRNPAPLLTMRSPASTPLTTSIDAVVHGARLDAAASDDVVLGSARTRSCSRRS